jgi:hypothetical protein
MKDPYIFNWIKKDKLQCDWLYSHILRKLPNVKSISLDANNTHEILISEIKRLKHGDALELFNMKARTAWNQYKRRKSMQVTHVTTSFEIKKNLYKKINLVAKKNNIPVSLAVEELLIKACEIETMISEDEYEQKYIASLRKKADKRIDKSFKTTTSFNKSGLSREGLIEHLTYEAYEKHSLGMKLIAFIHKDDFELVSKEQKQEYDRYSEQCLQLSILNLAETE